MRRVVLLLWMGCAAVCASLPDEVAKIRKLLRTDPWSAQARVSTLLVGNADSALVHAAAGDVAFRLGDFERADREYRISLSIDPQGGRALRGQGRLAEICSFRKTAKTYFQRAYEADPHDPEILRDWAGTQEGDVELGALEQYLRIATDADEDELEDVRAHIAMHKGIGDRELNQLASPYAPATIKLERVMNDRGELRGYGVAIKLNGGKTFHLLLDTGASGIVLNSKAGKRAGLDPVSESPLRGVGEDTDHSGSIAVAESLAIGNVRFTDYLVRISEDSPVKDVDGVIGTDVFQQFAITLNFPKATIGLDPFPTADGKPIAVEGFDYNRVRRDGFLDVFRVGAHMLIRGAANDTGVLLLLDSGAYNNVLSRQVAQQISHVRNDYSLRLSGVAGKVNEVYKVDRLKLGFADFEQTNIGVLSFDFSNISREEGVEIGALLGFPTLAQFIVELDYRNGLVRFTRP